MKSFGNGADLLAQVESRPIREGVGTFDFGAYKFPEPKGLTEAGLFRKHLLEETVDRLTEDRADYLLLAFDITGYVRLRAFERSVNKVLKETAVLSAMVLGQNVTPIAVLLNGETETRLFVSQLHRGLFDFKPIMEPMAIYAEDLLNSTPRQLELSQIL